ncbi:MAG: maleylacetoacetate isomerase [Castellaniella sp.]|uniref:maleylacetoacetate isomerase n=1 Tax=Castellaniella sp. TaxID=1955812 RepID=UPI00121EFAE1|nr:maleylacetoacetate isomerase [Castellaniella sp.]TAN27118.1 MAG: maleylacetoacetate isomerase [Castellaniella sp.]
MELYSFFNSSASYRVRIALGLKGLDARVIPVNIRQGEQQGRDYTRINPGALVPAFTDGDLQLGQSLAIIDYLDQRYPKPRLIPVEPVLRAHVLEFAQLIACDIHPVNNLRVLNYLSRELGVPDSARKAWYRHWITEGFAALETLLQRAGSGRFCFADTATLADCCLIPQVANAVRMGCDLDAYPRVMAVHEACNTLPAFIQAQPQRQPDFLGGP